MKESQSKLLIIIQNQFLIKYAIDRTMRQIKMVLIKIYNSNIITSQLNKNIES